MHVSAIFRYGNLDDTIHIKNDGGGIAVDVHSADLLTHSRGLRRRVVDSRKPKSALSTKPTAVHRTTTSADGGLAGKVLTRSTARLAPPKAEKTTANRLWRWRIRESYSARRLSESPEMSRSASCSSASSRKVERSSWSRAAVVS